MVLSDEKEDTCDSTEVHCDQESEGSDSETIEQMFAEMYGGGEEVPEYMREQIKSFGKQRKSEPAEGCSPKKPEPHDPINPDSVSDSRYLFKVRVVNSDCLRIPYEVAVGYFPVSSSTSFSEQIIQLTDPDNRHWPSIGYVYFDSEKAYILTRNWIEYARSLNLQLMDTIQFVKPNPRLGDHHFMTRHFTRLDSEPVQISLPKFIHRNRLFEVEFIRGDVRLEFGRLVIDAKRVKEYFPGIRTKLKQEMVKLTDRQNKNWFVKMVYSGFTDQYILMDDQWEGFVREHELEVGDIVWFYKPNIHSHNKHFLIQLVKREKGDGLTKSGKSDHVSDDDKKKTQEKQLTSEYASVLHGLGDENLALIESILESEGTSMDEYVAHQLNREINVPLQMDEYVAHQLNQEINPLQISERRNVSDWEIGTELKGERNYDFLDFDPFAIESPQKQNSPDPKEEKDSDSAVFGSSGSDHEDDENQDLIFEVEISESDCLIILMMNQDFPHLVLNPNQNETLQLTDNLGHKWEVTLNYDSDLEVYMITKGWSSYLQHYNLKGMDLIRCYKHVTQQNPNHFFILHQRKIGEYLFRVAVPRSNGLRIFIDRVEGHLEPQQLQEYTIHVTDYRDQTWEMKLVRFNEEEAFVVVQGWAQYVTKHGLRHKDRISFCKQLHSKKSNSFLIYHELRRRPGSDSPSGNADVELPVFLPENIIHELCLTEADVGSGRLMMTADEIPFPFFNRDIMKLTDENSKDWYAIIVKAEEGYMIIDGWEEYVKEYELEAGDLVRMYSPACTYHYKHFLIKCEKNKSKSEKEEEGGIGLGNPGAAPSQDDSYK